MHAAVIAINEAIEHENTKMTLCSLKNDQAHLVNVADSLAEAYQSILYNAKSNKAEATRNKVRLTG